MIAMNDIEYLEDDNWIDALRRNIPKSYRKTANGRYETFASIRSKTISLGTYDSVLDAENAVFDYRVLRLINGVEEYGLDIDDSVVFMSRYLAFKEGLIFNLFGERMIGAVDRCGYRHVILNSKNVNIHRIIATLFCHRQGGCDYVNHIDGNKQNNAAYNLEWVTRSENAKHAFQTGLQTSNGKGKLFTNEELEFIKNHCYEYYKNVAEALNRNPETVRKYMGKYRREFNND